MNKKLLLTTFFFSFFASLFAQWPPLSCAPSITNNNTTIGVRNVDFNSGQVNNTTSIVSQYHDFTNLVFKTTPGGTVSFSILNGTANTHAIRIFVDYSRDGVFDQIAPELVYTQTGIAANTTINNSFVVPLTTLPGAYRVRVKGELSAGNTDPCLGQYGEFEDYTMVVTSGSTDAQAVVLTSPGSFALGNNSISMRVANLSPVTMTTLDIGYRLANNTPFTETLSSLNIPSGGVFNATFTTPLNIPSVGTFPFKAWVGAVNGSAPPTANNDTVYATAIVCNSLAGSYSVGPSGDYATLTAAVQALINCGISAPVTFNVSAGTYSGQIDIPNISGSSPTNTIKFIGSSMASCSLVHNTANSPENWHILRFNGCSNVSFENFTIRSTTTAGWLVHFLNSIDCKLSKSKVEFSATNPTGTNYVAILVNGSNSTNSTQSATANNNTVDSCEVNNAYYGVYVNMTNGANNMFVSNTAFREIHYYGLYFSGNSVPKVFNNTINMRTPGTNFSYGMYFVNCNTSGTNFAVINNNKIWNAGQYGIGMSSCTGGGNISIPGEIYNNMIGSGFRNPTSNWGIYMNSASRYNVYHNNINMDANTTDATSSALFVQNGNTVQVWNNHLSISATGFAGAPLWTNSNTAIINTMNNNNYFNASGSKLLTISGVDYNINNFKAAFPNGGGTNSVNSNPGYVSNMDLNSREFCAIGFNLTALIPRDINGVTRPIPPTIGANEVTGVPNNDMAVLSIINPVYPIVSGSQSVKVVIRNNGANTVTSANVTYVFNNGTPVTQAWTGSLNSCDTAHITFTTPISITSSSNLVIYTSSPNGSADNNNLNDTLKSNVCVALSGTYTIGSTGDFPNFTSAINALSCGGITGNVTFNVQNGTYTEQLNIPEVNKANPTNQIVFQSLSGNPDDVTVAFNAPSTALNYTIRFVGGSYYKFQNMTFRANNATFGRILEIAAPSNNDTFINVKFIGLPTTSNTTNLSLVGSYGSLKYDFWTFDKCQFINGAYGSYFQSSTTNSIVATSEFLTYQNSVFTNQYSYGMYNQYMNGVRILNNTITTNSSLTSYIGIYNNYLFVLSDANKTLITDNRISGAIGGHGIYNQLMGISSTVTPARRFLIANNMVQIGTDASVIGTYGIRTSSDYGSDYLHNSVNMTGIQTTNASAAVYLQSVSSSTVSVQNNSFVSPNGAAAIRWDGGANFNPVNYNNLFTTGATLGYQSATARATIALWRTNTSRDINSLNVNPFYTSVTDLHTNSPFLNDTGIVTALVTTDIDGQVRCPNGGCPGGALKPDIGADEYESLALDAALTAITSPITVCPGGGASNVTVNIKNIGTSTLTSLVLNWSVNGNLQTPANWSGSLASNQEATNFNVGSFNFVSTTNIIKVWVSAPNAGVDGNPINDTLTVSPAASMSGNFTIGGASPDFTSFNDAINAISSRGVCGPIIFDVREGTYTEKLQINAVPGASAANFITFRADPANTNPVVLTDNTSTGTADNHTIFLNGASFIEFNGLTIINASTGGVNSVVRFALLQDSIVFRNNIITANPVAVNSTNYAVFNHGTGAANMISRMLIENNVINNGSYGIYLYGNTNTDASTYEFNNRIINNTFNNQFQYAIFSVFQRMNQINGNTIDMGASTATNSYGIYLQYIDTFNIDRNNIKRWGQYGIWGQNLNWQFGTGMYQSTINNNMIGGINTNVNGSGIYFQASQNRNIDIQHNSVSVNTTTSGYGIFLQATSAVTQFDNINIRNNSFANFGLGQAAYLYFSTAIVPAPYVVDYNNYFTNGTTLMTLSQNSFNPTQPNGLSPNFNSNSRGGDPQYLNNLTNLHSIGVQLYAAGVVIPTVTRDIDNDLRCPASGCPSGQATPCIGADEYLIPPHNTGITQIVNPKCPLLTTGLQDVVVTIRNFALIPMTSAQVHYRVGSNGTVNTVSWNGTLNPGATTDVTFTGVNQYDFTGLGVDTIYTWTTLPNGNADQFTVNDSLSQVLELPMNGVYTVGGTSPDFATLTDAVAQLNKCAGVSGPVTLNIRPGTYNEQVLFSNILGTSAINTITIQSETNDPNDVIYTFASNTAINNYIFELRGASFVKFKDLTLNATGATFATCLTVYDGSHSDSFFNVRFNGISINNTSPNYACVFSPTTNLYNFLYFGNCQFNNGSYGVHMQSNSSSTVGLSSSDLTFQDCQSTDNYAGGYYLRYLNGLRMYDNKIVTSSAYTAYRGIDIYWIYIQQDANKPMFVRNEIVANNASGYGMYLQYVGVNSGTITLPKKTSIFNNMISIGANNANSTYGIYLTNDYGSDIIHNTVNIRSTNTTNTSAAFWFQTFSGAAASQPIVTRNIFTGLNGSSAIRLTTPANFIRVDSNDLFTTGANLAFNNTTALTSLAAWRTSSSRDLNSINVNPPYISATNLRLTGSNILTVDVNPSIILDIDKKLRCGRTDIGAHSHPLSDDIGISAVLTPNGAIAPPGLNDIVVVLTNFGSNTVNSAVVRYTDGVTPRTINWNGTLAPCESVTITFTGANQYNFVGPWNLTFSTELPNGNTDNQPSNDAISLNGCVGLAGNYTIDPNGAGARNFTTFNNAVNAMLGCGIATSVVFTVAPGTYSEQVSIPAINGTSASVTVTFDGVNAANRILTFSGVTTANTHVLRFNNTRFVTFRNMSINTDNASAGWPVHFLDGSFNRVVRCNIGFVGAGATAATGNQYAVVVNGNLTGATTASTIASEHAIDSCNIDAGYYGVAVSVNNQSRIYVRNNNFTNQYYYGIYALNPVQMRINHNNFLMRTNTTATQDIYLQSLNLSGNSYFEIIGNRMTNSGQYAIYLNSCNNSGLEFNRINNNMIAGGWRSANCYGIYMTSVTRTKVYHNSINIDRNTTGTSACLYIINGNSNEVINNNLIVSATSAVNIFNLYVNPIGAAAVVDYNNYFTNSPAADVFVAASVPFNTVYPTGGGLNSFRRDPMFVSNTDLHTSIFCANKGIDVGITTDFDLQTRPVPPTIGADEPINTLSNDIGISEILSPSFPMVIGTQPIKVVLTNFGTNTVTSANVSYRVNGGTIVTQAWTGSLNTCDTVHITFNTQHNIFDGTSIIEAYTTIPNGVADNRPANDRLTISICPAMFGAYTIDPAGTGNRNFTTFNAAVSSLICAGISDNVTFTVAPGTYNEQVSIPNIQGSSATQTILFDGVSRTNRILSFNTTTAALPYVLRFESSNFVTFRNLTIRSNSTIVWAVHFVNGTNNLVRNCLIDVPTSTSTNVLPVLANGAASTLGSLSTTNANNMVDSSTLVGGGYGVAAYINNVNNLFTIKDNLINNSYQFGYFSSGSYQPRIIGNEFNLSTALATNVGINIQSCSNTQGNFIVVKGNKIIRTGQVGIYLNSCPKSGIDFNQVYNNMIGNFATTTQPMGIFLNSSNRVQVFHNSIDMNVASLATSVNAACYIQNGNSNDVRNNHFVISNPNAQNAFPLWISTVAAVSVVNSNNYLNNSSNFVMNIAGTLISRNGYKVDYPNGGGVNSMSMNPFFVSLTDLHSTNTCESGVDLTAFVSDDIDNESRSSTPDIGADEVNTVQSIDIGVYSINSPAKPVVPGVTPVSVTLRNYGSTTITSADIGYVYNNGAAVIEPWTGSLGPCDTVSFTFATPINTSGSTDFKAFTSMPNGIADMANVNDTAYLKACEAMAGTYTIGATGNYQNFTDAVNALYCGGISDNVTFNVAPDNYYEQLTILDLIDGLSPSRKVTFQSATGNADDVVLVASGTAANNFTLNLLNVNYLVFKDMTIRSLSTTNGTALRLTNASNDTFINVTFEGVTTTTNNTNMSTISALTGITNNIYFGNCKINNGAYGSYFNSNATMFRSENLTFENCVFTNQYAFGMFNQNLNGLRLIGNSITTNSILTTYQGMYNNQIAIFEDHNRILITGNRIWGAVAGTAMYNLGFGVSSTVTPERRPIVANNMIHIGMNNNTNPCIGIRDNSSVAGVLYIHNSVNVGGNSTANTSAAGYFENSSTGNVLLNNSFVGFAGNPALRINNIASFRSNFNNLFTTGANLAYQNTTARTTIALWRTNAQRDTNSVNVNPMYSTDFDLHSNQIALNNAGTPVGFVTTDFDGHVRCPNGGCFGGHGNPDIGADEFLPASFDGTMVSINTPSTICPGPANVQVTIKNTGSTTMTSASINYTINGVAQTPFPWTGSLAQGASANVNIGTPTFTASVSRIQAWISNPNGNIDQNNMNDTANFTPNMQLRGVLTIGGGTADFKNFTDAAIALNTRGICGPVTFLVREGRYGERIQLNAITGSSAANFINFRPNPANTRPIEIIVDGNTAAADNFTLFLNATSYIGFDGISMTNRTTGNTWGSVVRFAGIQDSLIFKNASYTGPITTSTSANLAVFNHGTAAADMANRVQIDSCKILNGSYGVYLYGPAVTSAATMEFRNHIRHSEVIGAYYTGLHIQNQRNMQIVGNKVELINNVPVNGRAIWMDKVDTFNLNRNYINKYGQYGIYLIRGNWQWGTGTYVSSISNNMIGGINTNTNANAMYLAATTSGTYFINIHHNSVSVNSGATGSAFWIQQTSLGMYSDLNIRNNSFANFGSGTNTCWYYFNQGSTNIPNLVINYNNYFNPTINNIFTIGNTTYSVATGGAALYNQNSLYGDPGYYDNILDLHSGRDQLNNKGQNIATTLIDIDNEVRPKSPSTIVDIGADEFNEIQNDIGVTAFLNNDVCTYNQALNVRVTNFGPQRNDSFRLGWSINGIVQPTLFVNPSNITQNNSMTIQVSPNFTFNEFTNYRFRFWTFRPNGILRDTFASNDTLTVLFRFTGEAQAPTVFPNAQCGTGIPLLQAQGANLSDSIAWYGQPFGGVKLGQGNSINGPMIFGSRLFYAQGLRYTSPYQISSSNGNTNVNTTTTVPYGGMLTITVQNNIVLDSFRARMGNLNLNTGYALYYRVGPYLGFQTSQDAWTLISTGRAEMFNQGGFNFARVPANNTTLLAGTTYSFYFTTLVDPTYPVGNWVQTTNGTGVTNTDANVSVLAGGAFLTGMFAANSFFNNWQPNVTFMYKQFCENGPRTPVLITVKPRPVSSIVQSTPFEGRLNVGITSQPDIIQLGQTNAYELVTPSGYTSTGHGTTWAINSLTVRTRFGVTVPPTEYSVVDPSASGPGKFIFKPTSAFLDSFVTFRYGISDFGPHFCDTFVERTVVVAPTPRPRFSVLDTLCQSKAVLFNNLSTIHSGFMTYKWYFGTPNNDSSDLRNPDFNFPSAGIYNVRLVATSTAWGVFKDTTIQVEIIEEPNVNFRVTNKCETIPVEFLNQTTIASSGTVNYTWNFGDNSANVNTTNASRLYTVPDAYRVTLTANYRGCITSITKNAYQYPKPVASFIAPSLAVCTKTDVSLTNTSSIAWSEFGTFWSFGDGKFSSQKNPTTQYNTAGTYNVRMYLVSEFDCKDSADQNVIIKVAPQPDFTTDQLCSRRNTTFSNTSIESLPNPTYTWTMSDGYNSNTRNAIRTWNNAGDVQVTLNSLYSNGCSNSITKSVDVLLQPTADFSVSTICSGESAVFVNKSNGDKSGINYNWDFGNGTGTEPSPVRVYNPTTTTNYNIELVASYVGGCSDTVRKPLTVNELPICDFNLKHNGFMDYDFTPSNTTYTKYDWFFGDGSSSTLSTPKHKFNAPGVYNVTLYAETAAGCKCQTTQTVGASTNVYSLSNDINIKVYPNPNNGLFNVENSKNESMQVEVYNVVGSKVWSSTSTEGSSVIDLSSAADGVYMVKVIINGSTSTFRVNIVH
jgi:hypothetical protein